MASIPRRRGGLLVAGLMTALAAVPARAQDPNIEYWRDYEVAFLDWCAQDSPTGCQCVMEALEATLTFDRFAAARPCAAMPASPPRWRPPASNAPARPSSPRSIARIPGPPPSRPRG
jgi:hypothetical protein